jgi:acyl transferase domain-containing protein
MEADISATVSVQEKEEARQVWLASKHDSINDQLRQLKNNKQQKGHGPVSGQGGV